MDNEPVNWLTPVTSMFLHGGWMHLLGNALYLWIFGNNVEDSMGRRRFVAFYFLCGLAAIIAQVVMEPGSPVPMVGASGAISGIMGAYLVLYPMVSVKVLVFIFVIRLPAFLVLLLWIGNQVLAVLPALNDVTGRATGQPSGGVAFMAHIGGFVAGVVLIKFFQDKSLVQRRHTGRQARGNAR